MKNRSAQYGVLTTLSMICVWGCFASCSGSGGSGVDAGSGGAFAAGGSVGTGGVAGATGAGGTTALGGSSGTGGRTPAGGSTGTGGRAATGGVVATGGTAAGGSAGATAQGGSTGTGGSAATGGSSGTGGCTGDDGFTYAVPGSTELSCSAPQGTLRETVQDTDWLCTFHIGGKTAYVYAQSKGTGAQCAMSLVPTFTTKAQVSVDCAVTTLANATYDWGGNHHNDSLQFDYEGKTYRYYHSSFGFGWRKCQNMDCLNGYAQGTTTLAIEGCTSARTLPEVCVPIKADGTHDPLVDAFKKCPGDSN